MGLQAFVDQLQGHPSLVDEFGLDFVLVGEVCSGQINLEKETQLNL
jgi:hypothetical protein